MAEAEDKQDTGVLADDTIVDPDRGDTAPRQLTEVEQLAHEMGWDPEHKPRDGKPVRTAQEWIKSTQANNRNLRAELKEMGKTVERIAATADKQVRREVRQQAQEIEERFAAAVEAKDTAGAAKAAKDMRELEADATPAPSNDDDAVAAFKRDNAWFGSDADATEYAASISNRLAREGITDPATQLARVREAVLKRFPEHDTAKPKPKTVDLDEPGNRTVAKPRVKTFADMPDIARAAADRFYAAAKTRMGDKTPDRKAWDAQYAKDYFAEQAA